MAARFRRSADDGWYVIVDGVDAGIVFHIGSHWYGFRLVDGLRVDAVITDSRGYAADLIEERVRALAGGSDAG